MTRKNILIVVLLLLIFAFSGYMIMIYGSKTTHKKVIATIYEGIREAKKEGNYKCCIEPDCTMCYISGNKWNYGKAGTCACDDFIALGEAPCPQCERGLGDGSTCDANIEASECEIKD